MRINYVRFIDISCSSLFIDISCSSLFIDISCSSPVPASAVPDNWCQKWDVQRRDDGSKKATLGAAECLQ